MRQVLKKLRDSGSPYHKLASLVALISAALAPAQATAQQIIPQAVPAVARFIPPTTVVPNVQITMPQTQAQTQTAAPRTYTADELENLYRIATRRGATVEQKKDLQRAVYPQAEWSDTTIDGAIGRDTRRRYARAMSNAGGFNRLSLQNAVYLVPPADLGLPNSNCAEGQASFANALCFDVLRLNVSDVQRYRPDVGRYHYGLDIAMPIGTAITVPYDSVVLSAGPASGYGRQVAVAFRINDDLECAALVGHVSSALVGTGQFVPAGTRIALSGNEGRSSGPHAHVELVCTNNDGLSLTAPNLASLQANGGLGAQPRFIRTSAGSDTRNDRLPSFLSGLMRNARGAFARLAPPQTPQDLVVTRVAANDASVNSGGVTPIFFRSSFSLENPNGLAASNPLLLSSGGAAPRIAIPVTTDALSSNSLTAREEDILPTSRTVRSAVIERNALAWRDIGLRPQ